MTESKDTMPSQTPQKSKRPSTILGRLTHAVREQNWFAVVLEICIVVIGVVIGFQVTAWGEGRSDRAKEQVYLRQLVADLHETERIMIETDLMMTPIDSAGTLLAHAFYRETPPTSESLAILLVRSQGYRPARSVVGTVEALVATGDIGLIRSDSLRSALTGYLDQNRTWVTNLVHTESRLFDGMFSLFSQVNYPELVDSVMPENVVDSLRLAEGYWPTPATNRAAPEAFDVESVLSQSNIRNDVIALNYHRRSLWFFRDRMLKSARELRRMIEAEIN